MFDQEKIVGNNGRPTAPHKSGYAILFINAADSCYTHTSYFIILSGTCRQSNSLGRKRKKVSLVLVSRNMSSFFFIQDWTMRVSYCNRSIEDNSEASANDT
jgi:hypothetical protein